MESEECCTRHLHTGARKKLIQSDRYSRMNGLRLRSWMATGAFFVARVPGVCFGLCAAGSWIGNNVTYRSLCA